MNQPERIQMKTEIARLQASLSAGGLLKNFMPYPQRLFLKDAMLGGEGAFFAALLAKLEETINDMPKPYDTDDQSGDAIVHLHYFRGSVDAWIIEKDATNVTQNQAFGKVCLTGDKSDAELGYVSIAELIQNGVELDLYWVPKPLKEI